MRDSTLESPGNTKTPDTRRPDNIESPDTRSPNNRKYQESIHHRIIGNIESPDTREALHAVEILHVVEILQCRIS